MKRSGNLLATALVSASVLYPVFAAVPAKLIWNASASVPIGLYLVEGSEPFLEGDLVAIDPPWPLAMFLAARGYLPNGVPLLKHILAVAGQTVCRDKLTISVDGREVGFALERDWAGRLLPVWQGCQRIPDGAVFVMNRQVRDSLDGRYFGLVSTDRIIGRAVPLWTDQQGDGCFQWRARTR
ncbi:S26 family signal peptidase [Mesorhizobium sp. USDA-HM6]|nr:S26 family signal peptidase [Mesorhizobium sp. USDA-HM6]